MCWYTPLTLNEQDTLNVYLLSIRLSIFVLTEQDRMNVSSVCVGVPPLTLNEQDTLNVYLLCIRLSVFILTEQDRINVSSVCVGVPPSRSTSKTR
jgi:hypothetical protein